MFRRLTAVRRFHGGGDLQEHLQEGQRVIHNGLRRGFCFSDLNAYEKQPCSSRFWYSSGQFACASASSRRFASRHVQEYYKAAASSHDVEPLADTDTTRDAARGVNGMVLKSHGVLGSSNLSAFRFRDALKAEAAIRNNFTKNPRSAQECFGSGSKAVNFRTTVSRTFGQRLSQFTVRVGFEERTGRHHAPRAFSTILTPSDWDCGSPEGPERVETDPAAIPELALDSVVKIFTMASSPNYFLPWQNKPQREITGSGFVISGRRIVTNAHVVADQTYVVVRKHGSPSKYRAEVRAVGHECDLALLSVHDEEFWEGMRTLQLGDIPYLQESVAVVGYPQGGDNISVTGGVVSRVEPTQYIHGTAHLMAIQIDAAINPGNSGGPALMEDKVVGVAFQNLAGAENIGYIIPVPIIKHFLEDVEERDCYVGFCSLGITCQPTENSQLREHLKMPPGLTGVLINRIEPLTDSNHWLRKDDVLLAFDGHPIANDGTVHFRNRERISFDHLVSMKRAGEKADLRIWRDGHVEYGAVTLNPLRFLTPVHQFDRLPSYFIFAGLVFTPLTQPYLHEYGDDWYNTAPRRICEKALTGSLTKPQEQVVLLSQVLVDEVNAGYERLADFQVQKVNGVEVINLKHLKELVESCAVQSLRFDLDDSRVLVLNFEKAKEASPKILSRHRIPSYASVDLLRKSSSDSKEEEKDPLVEKRAS